VDKRDVVEFGCLLLFALATLLLWSVGISAIWR